MTSKVSTSLIDSLTKGPSPTKITQVAAMQNYIQGLLGDTHHTFLQGSYKNDTATSDINDVDIVAVRINTYSTVHTGLRFPTSIEWENIFSEIEQKLRAQRLYTWTVERGDKCIKVRGAFKADVIPAVQISSQLEDPISVYSFRTLTEKLNYPRVHYANGVAKNKATGERYKPTVRMFKNWARNHFGQDKDIASSFKIEALVHDMGNGLFYDDYPATFVIGADAMLKKLEPRGLVLPIISSVCGGEIITHTWSTEGRTAFIKRLKESYDHALAAYKAGSITEADSKWRQAFNL